MKHKKQTIALLLAFSFFFTIAMTPTAKATNPLWAVYILMPNAVYSNQNIGDTENIVIIINRDIALIHVAFLNDSTISAPATDGFAFVFPLSRILNLVEWYLGGIGQAINIDGIRLAGTFNSHFEMYNDTNEDGVLTVIRNSTLNSTEASHLLIPYQYEQAYLDNLTPTTSNIEFPLSKPNLYTWGIAYKNVAIGVFNATFNNAGLTDGTWLANDSLAWVNYTYAYQFDSSNNQWQLNRSIALGAYNDVSEEGLYINKSIATVHVHAISRVNVASTPVITNNASANYNETLTLPSTYLDFSISSEDFGRWDMTETKPQYTVDGEEYNATSCSTPLATGSVALNITNEYFYDGNIDVNITGSSAISRICYNTWNGTVLIHDPFYMLPLLYPELPLWYIFLPDFMDFGLQEQQNLLLLILIIIIGCACVLIIAEMGGKKAKNSISKRRQRKRIKKQRQENAKTARATKKALRKRRGT